MIRAFILLCLLTAAPVARAHPHVFVDVGLAFRTDDAGRLSHVEVTWRYDAFYSMLLLSDRGLDADGDMVLTEAERAELLGFDLVAWEPDFAGALFLERDGAQIALDPPRALSVALSEGRLVTRHLRPLASPVPLDRLVVRPFDPTYYAALGLTGAVDAPPGCAMRIVPPDREAADARVEALGGFASESTFEEILVGRYYADMLILSCARS